MGYEPATAAEVDLYEKAARALHHVRTAEDSIAALRPNAGTLGFDREDLNCCHQVLRRWERKLVRRMDAYHREHQTEKSEG